MAALFTFHQGTESHAARLLSSNANTFSDDTSPLLGRFRAVPRSANSYTGFVHTGATPAGGHVSSMLNSSSLLGSTRDGILKSLGYGTLFGAGSAEDLGVLGGADGGHPGEGEEQAGEVGLWEVGGWAASLRDVWVRPRQSAVRKLVQRWWSRWAVLFFLPAGLVIGWCALPFPQYPFPEEYNIWDSVDDGPGNGHSSPGHGDARVQVNFWFFLFVYYGFYSLTALMWITKLFNIYSLNWWPQSIGFPITVSFIAILSIVVPIPIYYFTESREFLFHNTVWIFWTFIIMAMPVMVAFGILMSHERHLGLRQSLSETQRIFTQSWWTDETSIDTRVRRERRRPHMGPGVFDPNAPLNIASDNHVRPPVREAMRLRGLWIPASFRRFMWFCLALFIGLVAYVLGETYAEIYLRTLPHDNLETIVYVYSWIATIHILDGITGWILGGGEGVRVGSYPLGWIFKLYFSLIYQTYVRALYARLRSPSQFIILQLVSSTSLILFQPLSMSSRFHYFLNLISLNSQRYSDYKKYCGRSIFIRNIAENVSMISFLGQILVLHYGVNRNVYPYFAFDDQPDVGGDQVYTFDFTFRASAITWACEIVAAWTVRRIVGWFYEFNVTREGVLDLGAWPELLPTGVAVMVHVCQNMLFGIIRLSFR